MLSMTGYGRGNAQLGPSQVIVDVRTVNHRFLDLQLHVSPELSAHASLIDDCVRQRVLRGRVDVTARQEGPLPGGIAFDAARARAAFASLQQLRGELAPSEPLPLGLLASVPGLFRETGERDQADSARASLLATQAACEHLLAMRRAEGARLASDLRERGVQLIARLEALGPRLPALVAVQRERLLARIGTLLAETSVALDHGRLEHEVALLADRADVSEELTRLRAHAVAVDELLRQGQDDQVGHRLDFLLQEMSREANTAATKLPDAAATHVMLEIKAELMRMREQVQNVL
jgi:uncharacterized protein (TIGR00255 family)